MRPDLWLIAVLTAACLFLACGTSDDDEVSKGGLGEACHPDDTCDGDLICEEGVCVEDDDEVSVGGGLGEHCRPDGTCDAPYVCEEDICREADDETGPIEAASLLEVDPKQAVADGQDAINLKVWVQDADYQLLSGVSVEISVSGSGNVLSSTEGATDDSGAFESSLTSTKAEEKIITANVGDGAFELETTVNFRSGPPSADKSSLDSNKESALADGVDSLTLTLTARDAHGNHVPGILVEFSTDCTDFQLMPPHQVTEDDGTATTSLTSTVAGPLTVVADIEHGTFELEAKVAFAAGPAHTLDKVSGDGQTSTISEDFEEPFVVRVLDEHGNSVTGHGVTFEFGQVPDGAADHSLTNTSTFTDGKGLAETRLTVGKRAGQYEIVATGDGELIGDPASFTATAKPLGPTALIAVGGDDQSLRVGGTLEDPLTVLVVDEHENPVADRQVTFEITGTPDGASHHYLTFPSPVTGADGTASTSLTLGRQAGEYEVTATTADVSEGVVFTADALPGEAVTLQRDSPHLQYGRVKEPLDAFEVRVVDEYGNGVKDHGVTFEITGIPDDSQGDEDLSPTALTTDSEGFAEAVLVLGSRMGTYEVTATSDVGLENGTVTFVAEATASDPYLLEYVSGNDQSAEVLEELAPFVVRVKDQYENPVSGHSVVFTLKEGPDGEGGTGSVFRSTGADGVAQAVRTLGAQSGTYLFSATAANDLLDSPVLFEATAWAADAHMLAEVSGNDQRRQVGKTLEPFVVVVLDIHGNAVEDHEVTFAVTNTPEGATTHDLEGGFGLTDAEGRAQAVLQMCDVAGFYEVTATAHGDLEHDQIRFEVEALPGDAHQMALLSGDDQKKKVSEVLAPFVVRVMDAYDNPISGHSIDFAITTAPDGATNHYLSDHEVVSEADGSAETHLTPTKAGTYEVTATAAGELEGSPRVFSTTALVGDAHVMELVSGEGQEGEANETLSPFVVRVLDEHENPVEGHEVVFALETVPENAEGQELLLDQVPTGADGLAFARLRLGDVSGPYIVSVTADGDPEGSPLTFVSHVIGIHYVFPNRTWPNNPIDLEMEIIGAGFDSDAKLIWDVDQQEQPLDPVQVEENRVMAVVPAQLFIAASGQVLVTVEQDTTRFSPVSFTFGGVVPDTGQTKCYDEETEIACPEPGEDYFGQDAQYGWDVLLEEDERFQRYDHADDFTVLDTMTLLEWQGCVSGLEGEACQIGHPQRRPWLDAFNYCEALELGGHEDWGLPEIEELSHLLDAGEVGPSIDPVVFPETPAHSHVSSTISAHDPDNAWHANFSAGTLFTSGIGDFNHDVRCVRGPAMPTPSLHRSGPSDQWPVVRDAETGLMWQGCNAGRAGTVCEEGTTVSKTWKEALAYCESLEWGEYEDWRLPNKNELQSILDYHSHPPLNVSAFPQTSTSLHWTSSTHAGDPTKAWNVNFSRGRFMDRSKSQAHRVRCVRGGVGH